MQYTFSQKCKKIFSIALPSGANSLLDTLNLLVGWYFISQISKQHIIALGVSLNYIMILFAITAVFFIGTSSQVARYFGAHDFKSIKEVMGTNLLSSLFLSIPVCVAFFLCIDMYFDWMGKGVDLESRALGREYLHLVLLGVPALMAKTICVAGLSTLGDTKRIMYVKIFTTTLNVILNVVLIAGCDFGIFHIPALGIAGAGLSNLIVTIVEFVLLLFAIALSDIKLKIALVFRTLYLKGMLAVGIPAGIERFLSIFSLILIQKFVSSYGGDTLAGFQIGTKVEAFILMPGFGFQVAAMALVGQSLGRKRLNLAYDFLKTLLFVASLVMGILGILICIFGFELSGIFSTESKVLEYSFYYILAVGLSQVPLIWVFCLDGALRGGGATKLSLLLNSASIWLVRILPMYLCVHFGLSVMLLFVIIFAETYLRAVLFGLMFKYKIWEKFISRF